MVQAKCNKCGGTAAADTFEQARQQINHAVGLSRGIKCGDNYNFVQEIKSEIVTKKTLKVQKPIVHETLKSQTTKTDNIPYKKVEGKSTKSVKLDESKSSL